MERFLSPVAVVRGLYFEKIGNNDSYLLIPRQPCRPFLTRQPPFFSILREPFLFLSGPPYLLARIQLRVIGSLWRQLRDFSKWRHQPIPIERVRISGTSGKPWWRKEVKVDLIERPMFPFIGKEYRFDFFVRKGFVYGILDRFLDGYPMEFWSVRTVLCVVRIGIGIKGGIYSLWK